VSGGGLRLEARHLAAARGTARLFDDLSFGVHAGEVLLVRGPNGAGKTTLLRILAGLARPVAGQLALDGEPLDPHDARLRACLAFLGHAPAHTDELSAFENLAALVALAGVPASASAIHDALAAAGLARVRDLPARALSQGQRRRVGLARLAAVERALWILDEPATALDAAATGWVEGLLAGHAARGGMAIVATHQGLALPNTRCATLTLAAA
jgi:heme exporter protein A